MWVGYFVLFLKSSPSPPRRASDRFVSNEPHDKTVPEAWGRTTAAAGAGAGRRKRGAVGPQGSPRPALAVGPPDRTAGGDWEWASRWEAEEGRDGACGLPGGRRIFRARGRGAGRAAATARGAGRGGPAGTAVGGGENPAATHGRWLDGSISTVQGRHPRDNKAKPKRRNNSNRNQSKGLNN